MFDQQARVERVLARHPDAMVVEPVPGRPALVRRDEILVAGRDAGDAEDAVRRWCDSRHDGRAVTRLRLRTAAKVDVCELASRLAGDGGPGGSARRRRLSVSPNHLVHGQPMWWSGPADLPRPAKPLPAPEAAAARREVTVAVLDTGLSPHPWYEDAEWFREQRDEVREVLDADLDFDLDAQAGHGTFVAGMVLRHAPTARLLARRVIGGDGVGDELDVIRALEWLAGRRADVVNISLGCHTFDDRPSPVLARALAALGRRTVVVACAGNTAGDRPFWPAAAKPVVGVAALDGGDRAWFSNHGWWVDACAQGADVTSTFVRFNGTRPAVEGTDPDDFRGYATWSGTSFAAPVVAGRIAGLAAAEGIGADEAADRVLDPEANPSLPGLGVVVGS